ncbi:Phospholipase C [Tulasnella sp. 332]|nr:Phospholipase C [Tulasnella sp. 332]
MAQALTSRSRHVLLPTATSPQPRDLDQSDSHLLPSITAPRIFVSGQPYNGPESEHIDLRSPSTSRDPLGVTLKAYTKVKTVALEGKRRALSDSGGLRPIFRSSSAGLARNPSLPRFRTLFSKSAAASHRVSLSMDQAEMVQSPDSPSRCDILPLPEGSTAEHYELIEEIKVPALLQQGTPMLKISAKQGTKLRKFWLDADQGQVLWESRTGGLISIENIREMRTGANARNYRELFKIAEDAEPRWMTIIYLCDGKYKTLHVVALSVDVFHMWNTTLRKLHSLRRELMSGLGNMERRQLVWEKQYWKAADTSEDSRLDFGEVEKMCTRLNIYSPRSDLWAKFEQVDTDRDGHLDFNDFRRFVTLLKARPDIEKLYSQYSTGGRMEYHNFENLMRQTQKTALNDEQLRQLFEKYSGPSESKALPTSNTHTPVLTSHHVNSSHALATAIKEMNISMPLPPLPPATLDDPPFITLASFTTFLMSSDNAAFSDQAGQTYQDMTHPISEYFISSSHNTYLVGSQLVGESTCEGYIRVLLQGCRSVELDIWDGDVEPCVYHGRTLTSKVSVREVSRAIMKYAFVASPYPIIISCEIHCSVHQQNLLARIFREEFGNALLSGPLPGREHERQEGVRVLPSPDDLKGKILLKAKKLYAAQDTPLEDKDVNVDADSSITDTTSSASEQEATGLRGLMEKVREGGAGALLSRGKFPARGVSPAQGVSSKAKAKVSEEFSALLFYTVGVKCKGLNKKETYEPVHLFSLSEKTASKIMKASMVDLIKHNRTHMIRIYPKGTRMSSTNYEPHRYWASGAHLVALNWQTSDLGYMINHAMFQRNGGCGMVLKPEALRLKDKQSLTTLTKHYLDVTIISAQQLPRPKDREGRELHTKAIIDPFVEVSLHVPDWSIPPPETESVAAAASSSSASSLLSYSPTKRRAAAAAAAAHAYASAHTHHHPIGVAASARTVSMRTHVIDNNGFNPLWQHEMSIPFDLAGDMKDLVFVRFEVRDRGESEENPVGVYCVSLGSLMMGYRHLPLHDQQMSQYLFSTLFVKINIRDV